MKIRLVAAIVLLVGCTTEIDGSGWPPSYTPPNGLEMDPICEQFKFVPNDFLATKFPINVVLDANLTDHNIEIMLDAIEAWNTRLKMEVLYASITKNLTMHDKCNYAELTDTTDLMGNWIGLTTFGKCGSDIVNVETMQTKMEDRGPEYYTDDLVLNLTVHELGHVLGLGHELDPKSVMFESMGPGDIKYISTQSYCLVQQTVIHTQL